MGFTPERKRELARELASEYLERPCSIEPRGKNLWIVSGMSRDGKGGGIIAWCYDRVDAVAGLLILEATQDYRNLSMGEYATIPRD